MAFGSLEPSSPEGFINMNVKDATQVVVDAIQDIRDRGLLPPESAWSPGDKDHRATSAGMGWGVNVDAEDILTTVESPDGPIMSLGNDGGGRLKSDGTWLDLVYTGYAEDGMMTTTCEGRVDTLGQLADSPVSMILRQVTTIVGLSQGWGN